MSYALSADDAPAAETEAVVLSRVDQNAAALVQWTKDEDKRRKIALIVAGASAVFAMVKLGWVVIPWFRKRRGILGQLGQPAAAASSSSNPARRRRR